MAPMLRLTPLSVALLALLAACSPGTSDPAPTQGDPEAGTTQQAQVSPGPEGPPVAQAEDTAGTGDEADESLLENLKVRPVSHEALEATLLVGEEGRVASTIQAYGQTWAVMEEGAPGALCVKNIAGVPALASLSFQGLNVDLRAANPIRDMWRIEPQSTRCFSFIGKDDDRPLIAAWHIFFGYGEDGFQVVDLTAPAAASGFIRLEEPSKTPPPDAWPGIFVSIPSSTASAGTP